MKDRIPDVVQRGIPTARAKLKACIETDRPAASVRTRVYLQRWADTSTEDRLQSILHRLKEELMKDACSGLVFAR